MSGQNNTTFITIFCHAMPIEKNYETKYLVGEIISNFSVLKNHQLLRLWTLLRTITIKVGTISKWQKQLFNSVILFRLESVYAVGQTMVIAQQNIANTLLQYFFSKKRYLNSFSNSKNIALLQYFFKWLVQQFLQQFWDFLGAFFQKFFNCPCANAFWFYEQVPT